MQNRIIYQDRTTPEGEITSRINRLSESFPLDDPGLIRRNWKVGLRVIFGLFWAADAYLKWSLIAQGIDYRDLVSSAAEGQPSTVASWIRFWAGIAGSTPGFPYVIAVAETLIAIFIIIGLFKLHSQEFSSVSSSGVPLKLSVESSPQVPQTLEPPPLYMAMFAGLIVVRAGMQRGVPMRPLGMLN